MREISALGAESNMLLDKLYDHRWFFWTITFLLVAGLGLASYVEWVNIEMQTQNYLL